METFIKKNYLSYIFISIIIISFIFYLVPIYHVNSEFHKNIYMNVFKAISPSYYWCLNISLVLFVISIFTNLVVICDKKLSFKWKIVNYVIFTLTIIFTILTFIFAFGLFTNMPK